MKMTRCDLIFYGTNHTDCMLILTKINYSGLRWVFGHYSMHITLEIYGFNVRNQLKGFLLDKPEFRCKIRCFYIMMKLLYFALALFFPILYHL